MGTCGSALKRKRRFVERPGCNKQRDDEAEMERKPARGNRAASLRFRNREKTKMHTVELAKKIEKAIYDYLVEFHFSSSPNLENIATVLVYKHVDALSQLYPGVIVTTRFFNTVVSDMKRVGLIGTAKGGEVMFLSDYSWGQERDKRNQNGELDKLRQEIAEYPAKDGGVQ
jgi:hypothetical protein